jgi:hypothetical protein
MSSRGHHLYFFFTPSEQAALIKGFEAKHNLSYYRTGVFPQPVAPMISSLLDEKSLGHLAIGDWNHSASYLLTAPDEEVIIREITLRKGGYAYAVDQSENTEMARFKPSGQFAEGILVAGSLVTLTRVSYSGILFQALLKLIKKRTRHIGAFWVGPEAEEKLRLDWRLVTTVTSPQEYDLALE